MKPSCEISRFHQNIEEGISQASIVFQFHNIYTAVSEEPYLVHQGSLTEILQLEPKPPMSIPLIPAFGVPVDIEVEAFPLEDGISVMLIAAIAFMIEVMLSAPEE